MVKQIKNAFRKKRTMRKKYRKKRTFRKDNSIVILNDKKSFKPITVYKTNMEYRCYGWVATQVPDAFFTFDPAGVYGNNSPAGTAVTMPDWGALVSVYDQYKVKKITVNLRFENTGANNVSYPVYIRYSYDKQFTSPDLIQISELPRVIQKTFSNDNLTCSYSFYPKHSVITAGGIVQDASGNYTIEDAGTKIKGGGWFDVDKPTELMGFLIMANAVLPTGCNLYMSVEYQVKFKYCN